MMVDERYEILDILAPLSGTAIGLDEVPDPAFACGAIGAGVAVVPEGEVMVAPVHGKVAALVSSGHAVGFLSRDGLEILVHVGVDTVYTPGVSRFFRVLVKQGDTVRAGQPVIHLDLQGLKSAGVVLTSPVVVTAPQDNIELLPGTKKVAAGIDVLFRVKRPGE